MKEGLAVLFVRKTKESRRNAGEAVEHWRMSVETAERAAKQAEYELTLPSALTKPISRLAEEIPSVCHVSAIGIAARSLAARGDVIKITIDGLEKEHKSRGEELEAANRALMNLKRVYEEEMGRANSQKEKSQTRNAFYTPPVLPTVPRFRDGAAAGLGLGCLSIIVLFAIALIVPAVDKIDPDSLLGSILILGPLFGGWLIVPMWKSISHTTTCQRLEAEARARAKAEASGSLTQAEKMLADAEREHNKQSPICERAVEDANQQVQKSESTLKWLRVQW